MRVRLATGFLLACLLSVAAPASGHEGIHARKDAIDSRIDSLQAKIEAALWARLKPGRKRTKAGK